MLRQKKQLQCLMHNFSKVVCGNGCEKIHLPRGPPWPPSHTSTNPQQGPWDIASCTRKLLPKLENWGGGQKNGPKVVVLPTDNPKSCSAARGLLDGGRFLFSLRLGNGSKMIISSIFGETDFLFAGFWIYAVSICWAPFRPN